MRTFKSLFRWPQLITFCIWLLLGLSVAYWWLLAQGKGAAPLVQPVSVAQVPEPSTDKVAWALGGVAGGASGASGSGAPGATDASGMAGDARFNLLGLVAQADGSGVALIAVNGQAAKPYRAGALVLEPYYLAKVQRQSVLLRTQAQSSTGLEIKLNPVPVKTAAAGNMAPLLVPALPMATGVAPVAPAPMVKSDATVTGADEAAAPSVPRPTLAQVLGGGGKGSDAGAKAAFSEMIKSAGGIGPPMPGGSAAH